jgi:hypothetical protein
MPLESPLLMRKKAALFRLDITPLSMSSKNAAFERENNNESVGNV